MCVRAAHTFLCPENCYRAPEEPVSPFRPDPTQSLHTAELFDRVVNRQFVKTFSLTDGKIGTRWPRSVWRYNSKMHSLCRIIAKWSLTQTLYFLTPLFPAMERGWRGWTNNKTVFTKHCCLYAFTEATFCPLARFNPGSVPCLWSFIHPLTWQHPAH